MFAYHVMIPKYHLPRTSDNLKKPIRESLLRGLIYIRNVANKGGVKPLRTIVGVKIFVPKLKRIKNISSQFSHEIQVRETATPFHTTAARTDCSQFNAFNRKSSFK